MLSSSLFFHRLKLIFSDAALRTGPIIWKIRKRDIIVLRRIVNVTADKTFEFFHRFLLNHVRIGGQFDLARAYSNHYSSRVNEKDTPTGKHDADELIFPFISCSDKIEKS